jgi:hypothetical protein
MPETDLLIILAFLIIAAIGYFVPPIRNKRRGLQKLKGPPLPIFDRIADNHINLLPGMPVPRSGNYECIICARGGYQDSTTVALFGAAEAQRRLNAQKPTMQFFSQNSIFPPCPNCGDAGGWSLLK